MFFKEPKDTKEFYWTLHIKEKMRYYGLGEGRLRRILKTPIRREEGIALNTIASMQFAGTKKQTEIWLMHQLVGKKKKMISAWRYPGISPKGKPIIIPDDIIAELRIITHPDPPLSGRELEKGKINSSPDKGRLGGVSFDKKRRIR